LNSKNHKRDMVAVALDGSEQNFDCYHEILDVTLKSGGERYVLDLAGAQVGYYEPVTPYEEYFESRVREFLIYDSFPNFSYFGGRLDCALSRAAGEDLNPSNESLCTIVNDACRKVLKAGVVEWEKEQDIEIGAMLLLPQQGFELRQKELVDYISDDLQNFVIYLRQQSAMAKAAITSGGRLSA
jgi:hypothetical protein